jgi:hypothetical protein
LFQSKLVVPRNIAHEPTENLSKSECHVFVNYRSHLSAGHKSTCLKQVLLRLLLRQICALLQLMACPIGKALWSWEWVSLCCGWEGSTNAGGELVGHSKDLESSFPNNASNISSQFLSNVCVMFRFPAMFAFVHQVTLYAVAAGAAAAAIEWLVPTQGRSNPEIGRRAKYMALAEFC